MIRGISLELYFLIGVFGLKFGRSMGVQIPGRVPHGNHINHPDSHRENHSSDYSVRNDSTGFVLAAFMVW